MIYTPAIKRAIKFSIKTHEVYQKQKRKGKDVAFIIHPLSVGMILALAGAKEDVIVAGILHDTIEDSIPEKKVTKHMLEERFGKKVAELVMTVTENRKILFWQRRKNEMISRIESYSRDSVLIKSADVISNMSELIDDHARYGDQVFKNFSSSKRKLLAHYMKVTERLLLKWKANPLRRDLKWIREELQKIGNK